MIEFVFGSEDEQKKLRSAQTAARKTNPKKRDLEAIEAGSKISRRLMLRRTGLGLGLAALAAGAPLAYQYFSQPESNQEAIDRLTEDFRSLAALDEEADRLFNFFLERRRVATLRNGELVTQEKIDPVREFALTVVDPRTKLIGENGVAGVASFSSTSNPPRMTIKNVQMNPIIGGTLLAHETLHAYQWLSGFERTRRDGYILGEHDAYTLEFRLMDRATDGRFNELLTQVSSEIPPGNIAVGFPKTQRPMLNKLFGIPLSDTEDSMREVASILALDYKIFERDYGQNAQFHQVELIRSLFNGSVKLSS